MPSPTIQRPNWIALLLFAAAATLLIRHALLPEYALLPLDLVLNNAPWTSGEMVVPQNPLISDPFYSFYPRRHLLTEAIQQGEWPLWNPYVMAGTPNIANPNFQLFYWPNLITAVFLSAVDALSWLAWGHLILSGMLMYLFLRRHRLAIPACWLGGMVWLLNGYTLVWLENTHRLSTTAWIPGIFWAYETAVQTKKVGWAALGGLMLGTSILGGQVQFIFAVGLIFGLYGLIGAVVYWRDGERDAAWRSLWFMLPVGLIGLGIGSLVLLPSAEFAQISQRRLADAGSILESSWPLTQLITLLAPNFFGNPLTGGYWGKANYAEMTAYFGAGVLLLAITAPIVARHGRFLIQTLGITLFSLLVVLGTPLVELLFLFPGAQFLSLKRLLFLIPFVGSLLVGLGLDGWWQRPSRQRTMIALGVTFSILTVSLLIALPTLETAPQPATAWWSLGRGVGLLLVVLLLLSQLGKRPFLIGTLLVLVAAADLLQWGWRFNPITPTTLLYPDSAITTFLAQDGGLYRVLPLQTGPVLFGPNVLSLFDVQTLGGYTPLIPKAYAEVYKSVDDEVAIDWMAPNHNMLVMSNFDPSVSLLNVKYVLSTQPLPYETVPQNTAVGCDDQLSITSEPLTMLFVIDDAGFNRFDVQFGELIPEEAEAVTVWLWREEGDGSLLFQETISAQELQQTPNRAFFMAPVADSAGQTFVLGLQSAGEAVPLCGVEVDGRLQPSLATYATWLSYRMDESGVWVYENPNVLPRAYLVHHVEQVAKSQLLSRLHAPDFNGYHSALVSEPFAEIEQLAERPLPSQATVSIDSYTPQQVKISVDTPAAGLLVLTDIEYPGWHATLDGQSVEIVPVNHAFRGIFVPPGAHEIQFSFRSQTLTLALIIAGVSLLAAVGILVKSNLWSR